jgi:dienelactone hydrolase
MISTRIYSLLLFLTVFAFSSCSSSGDQDNEASSFESDRSTFSTALIDNDFVSDGPTPLPPDSIFELVSYNSEVGPLDAYLSTNIDTTKKYPAIVWAHGGFGGIGSWYWGAGSYVRSFVEAEFVVLCPSWRGENENPGDFELFYGEVNDLNNAVDYAASLSYVDTNRIYLAGHSTGGTMALLTTLVSKKLRATFSFGGAPDIRAVVADGAGYGNTPYNYKSAKESAVRSAINYVEDIKSPIFYFEGEESFYSKYAMKMEQKAKKAGKPFKAFIVPDGDHFGIVWPITNLIVEKINADTGEELNIDFTLQEILTEMR